MILRFGKKRLIEEEEDMASRDCFNNSGYQRHKFVLVTGKQAAGTASRTAQADRSMRGSACAFPSPTKGISFPC